MNLLHKRLKISMIKISFITLSTKTEKQNKNNTLYILGKTIRIEVEPARKDIHRLLVKGC